MTPDEAIHQRVQMAAAPDAVQLRGKKDVPPLERITNSQRKPVTVLYPPQLAGWRVVGIGGQQNLVDLHSVLAHPQP